MNPWLMSYLCLAMLCCVVVSAVFLWINLESIKNKERIYIEEKLAVIVEDLETQLEIFEDMGLKIKISNYYKPFYYQRNKYYEKALLEDFSQYLNYSPLVDELFLYHQGEKMIFCSDETTAGLKIFLEQFSAEEQEKIAEALYNPREQRILSTEYFVILLFPLNIESVNDYDTTLGVMIKKDILKERMQVVSGGLNGDIAIYAEKELVLDALEKMDITGENIFSCTGWKLFTVYYDAGKMAYFSGNLLAIQIMAIISLIIVVVFLASFFAWHSWKPVVLMIQKYRPSVKQGEEVYFENALEEINYMLEAIIGSNAEVNSLLEQKQNQLRNQLLILLLEGKYTFNIQAYLAQAQLNLPGPWFFVMSVSLKEEKVDEMLLENLSQLYKEYARATEGVYLYPISNIENKTISIICSVVERLQREEIYEEVCELTETCGNKARIGLGNIYENINHLSTSYLEALDRANRYMKKTAYTCDKDVVVQNKSEGLYRIINAMLNGKADEALEALEDYFTALIETQSVLMQQYFFSNFYVEMGHVYKKEQLELPEKYISLSVSTKNIAQFMVAAREMVSDFFEQLAMIQAKKLEDDSYGIVRYVNEHFMDYEITIENVAEEMNTNVLSVRSAIKKHSGKSYKEYMIFLRIEYAKELLLKKNLTVAETCQKVGYSNISHFIKIFKTYTGVTPAEYKVSDRKE